MTQIYDSQQEAIKSSEQVLIQRAFERQTYELAYNVQTFALFQNLFEEIYGQESALLTLYEEALKKLPPQ